MGQLRAAVITDIHYGIDDRAKLGTKAPKLMEYFIKAVARHMPDVVVDMGDRITARGHDQDKSFMQELAAYFNKLAAPVHSVLGNHDVFNLSPAENEEITASPAESYSMDVNGFHLVFWSPVEHDGHRGAMVVNQSDLDWLQNDLAATQNPAIVFSHVPLDNVSEQRMDDGREDFGDRFGFPKKGAEIRRIMEESGKVVLCMNGHIHDNRHREINGIHYISQQSFTHQHQEYYRVPSRTWSLLEANDNEIKITLKGKLPRTYHIPLPQPPPPAA